MEPTQNTILVGKQAYKLIELWSSNLAMSIPMEMPIGCAPDWVESSKEIDSLAALCTIRWTINNYGLAHSLEHLYKD